MPQKLVTATNPETNENIVLVDGEWKSYTQSATDKSGRSAFLVDNKWVAEEAPPPSFPEKVASSVTQFAREVVNPVLAPYATVGGAGFLAGGPLGAATATLGLGVGDIATSVMGMKTPSQSIRELYGENIISEPTNALTRAMRTTGEFLVPGAYGSRQAQALADVVQPSVTQNVLKRLAETPGQQTIGAGGAGTAVAGTEYLGGDPYAQLAAGLVGGMVPSAAAAGTKAIGQKLYSLTEPLSKSGLERVRSRALLESFNNDPMRLQAAIDMLESGMTPEQVAVRTNNSSFASLLATTRYAKPNVSDMYRARDAAVNQRMENELADVNRRLANEAGRLESQAIILPRGVPGADQPRMGRQITVAREQEIEKVRREVVRPAYEAAFNAAPDSFSIEPVIIAARQIESDPLTRLNPGLAEKTSQILSEYKFTMPKDVDAGFGSVGGERPPARPVPPQVTLEGADSIIKAINMDVAKLLGKTDSESVKTLSNLYKLRSAVDESIKAGVPEKANSLYKEALNLYQTRIAAPFREGWVANLEREGATGVQMVAPAKVVSTIINPADPDNARRFVLALGDNKRAMAATKAGILDLYKQKVVKGAKIAPEDHEKFMRDHAAALGILDNAGMGIRAELNKFGKVATSVEGRRSRLEDLTRYVNEKTAGLTATPEQSARNVTAAALDEPGVRQVVDEINRTLNDQRAFVKLVNDASRSSGVGPGKIVAQDRELPPFLDSNVMLANWIIARLKGKLDTKQAADLAVELLNSNTAARALGNALEERVSVFGTKRKAYQRGAVGEALFYPYKFPPALAITPQVPAAISREDRNKLRREEQNRNALAR